MSDWVELSCYETDEYICEYLEIRHGEYIYDETWNLIPNMTNSSNPYTSTDLIQNIPNQSIIIGYDLDDIDYLYSCNNDSYIRDMPNNFINHHNFDHCSIDISCSD